MTLNLSRGQLPSLVSLPVVTSLGEGFQPVVHLLLGLMVSPSTGLGQEALEGWRSIGLIHGAPASQLIKYLFVPNATYLVSGECEQAHCWPL